MKKLTTAIVLSMSGLIATTAMAAPNDHDRHGNYPNHEVKTVKVIKKTIIAMTGEQVKLYPVNISTHVMQLTTAHIRN